MKRLDVTLKMREIGAIPLYYHPDIDVCKEVISSCYKQLEQRSRNALEIIQQIRS